MAPLKDMQKNTAVKACIIYEETDLAFAAI